MSDNLTWNTIRDRIATLREHAKQWHAERPDEADFMPTFAGEADGIIEDAASLSDDALDSAHQVIDEILIELGYMDPAERQT